LAAPERERRQAVLSYALAGVSGAARLSLPFFSEFIFLTLPHIVSADFWNYLALFALDGRKAE
jgi:hypothetical protein